MDKEDKKKEELKELVLARLNIMPPTYKLSLGGKGTFTKDELIKHVKKGDETGSHIIDMQMNFINALTSGKLIKTLNQ